MRELRFDKAHNNLSSVSIWWDQVQETQNSTQVYLLEKQK